MYAVTCDFEIIGEAARQIPEDVSVMVKLKEPGL
jgi:uncharacterized protein with HEPN domain